MSLTSVLAAVTYPTNVTGPGISAIPTGHALRGTIQGWITNLYASPKAAQILEAAAAAGNLSFVQTTGSTGAGQTTSGQWIVAINLSEIQNLYYFNDKGQLVHEIPELTLIHEIIHTDPPKLTDPLPINQVPSNAMMDAGFDFEGDASSASTVPTICRPAMATTSSTAAPATISCAATAAQT